MHNKFKYAVYCLDQGNYHEDEFIEEFENLKKAKEEAERQAGQELGEAFYVMKYRKVFEIEG